MRQEAENSLQLLRRFTKYGLGLSKEAIYLPANVDQCISSVRKDRTWKLLDPGILEAELKARIADENFVVTISTGERTSSSVVAGVDGSLRGGILSFLGEGGRLRRRSRSDDLDKYGGGTNPQSLTANG